MRRCTSCFRFHPGRPPFCTHCGRSFDVRLCPRGHRNSRGAEFCAECGTADLSIATPPSTLLHQVSGVVLTVFAGLLVLLVTGSLALAALSALDWSAVATPLAELAVMVGFLYWTSTLLPGPVKKVGRAVGRTAWSRFRRKKS